MNKYKNTKAFTLVEILIVVGIFAIIASIAAPQMSLFVNKRQGYQAYKLLEQDISYARSLAQDSTLPYSKIYLIPKDSTNWAKGWEIRGQTSSGKVLREQPTIDNRLLKIQSNDYNLNTPIIFNSQGYINISGEFRLLPASCAHGEDSYSIKVARSGLTNSLKITCAAYE